MITVDFSRLELAPGSRVLDMGCGSGRHLAEAARFDNVTVVGSDLCFEDLKKARERMVFHQEVGETGGGPWDTMVSDVTNLPFADQSFDLVICSEVLEHVPDHNRAVSELGRVLKDDGTLVVSVPRFLPERICWALSDDYYNANGGHIRIYHRKTLYRLLENAGFTPWADHYAHGIHSPYWWLKCLVGPNRTDSKLVNLYHDFLVWDIMKKPRITRTLDRLTTPVIGKSMVVYCAKNGARDHH